jgi:hypothetical protein
MEGTARIWFTPQQKAELWERWNARAVRSAVSTDRRQCHARSLRAPQALALPKPSGVALE